MIDCFEIRRGSLSTEYLVFITLGSLVEVVALKKIVARDRNIRLIIAKIALHLNKYI